MVMPDDISRPTGVPADLTEHIRLMCDLMVLAFQTDSTRISTFIPGREGSEQKYRMVGVNEGHHSISHHMNKQENLDKLKVINTYLVTQLAYFTGKLKSVTEGEGTLLDNCMVTFGSAIADPNRHNHHDLPLLMVGRGGGTIKTGRHVLKAETPLNNLWPRCWSGSARRRSSVAPACSTVSVVLSRKRYAAAFSPSGQPRCRRLPRCVGA